MSNTYTTKYFITLTNILLLWQNTIKIALLFQQRFQHIILLKAMIGKWRRHLGTGDSCSVLLTNLIEASEYMVHDFLIAKVEASGFTWEALNSINSFLSDMNDFYSSFLNLRVGILESFVLGPLLLIFSLETYFSSHRTRLWLAILMTPLPSQMEQIYSQFWMK